MSSVRPGAVARDDAFLDDAIEHEDVSFHLVVTTTIGAQECSRAPIDSHDWYFTQTDLRHANLASHHRHDILDAHEGDVIRPLLVHAHAHLPHLFERRIDLDVLSELLARVKANIRRTTMLSAPAAEDNAMSAGGGITINTDSFQVRKNGVPIDLTQREYELLTFLASHPGKVFSRVDLMEQVWNYGYVGDDARTVDVTVRRLREKIEDNPAAPAYILTRRGVGYYFSAQA